MDCQRILLATDFSESSDIALELASQLASEIGAIPYITHVDGIHVIDSLDVSEEVIRKNPRADKLRQEINAETTKCLNAFLKSVPCNRDRIQVHLSWGATWKEVCRATERVHADLIAMGTVGGSGIKGLLLGNTAEKVLSACPCSILTV